MEAHTTKSTDISSSTTSSGLTTCEACRQIKARQQQSQQVSSKPVAESPNTESRSSGLISQKSVTSVGSRSQNLVSVPPQVSGLGSVAVVMINNKSGDLHGSFSGEGAAPASPVIMMDVVSLNPQASVISGSAYKKPACQTTAATSTLLLSSVAATQPSIPAEINTSRSQPEMDEEEEDVTSIAAQSPVIQPHMIEANVMMAAVAQPQSSKVLSAHSSHYGSSSSSSAPSVAAVVTKAQDIVQAPGAMKKQVSGASPLSARSHSSNSSPLVKGKGVLDVTPSVGSLSNMMPEARSPSTTKSNIDAIATNQQQQQSLMITEENQQNIISTLLGGNASTSLLVPAHTNVTINFYAGGMSPVSNVAEGQQLGLNVASPVSTINPSRQGSAIRSRENLLATNSKYGHDDPEVASMKSIRSLRVQEEGSPSIKSMTSKSVRSNGNDASNKQSNSKSVELQNKQPEHQPSVRSINTKSQKSKEEISNYEAPSMKSMNSISHEKSHEEVSNQEVSNQEVTSQKSVPEMPAEVPTAELVSLKSGNSKSLKRDASKSMKSLKSGNSKSKSQEMVVEMESARSQAMRSGDSPTDDDEETLDHDKVVPAAVPLKDPQSSSSSSESTSSPSGSSSHSRSSSRHSGKKQQPALAPAVVPPKVAPARYLNPPQATTMMFKTQHSAPAAFLNGSLSGSFQTSPLLQPQNIQRQLQQQQQQMVLQQVARAIAGGSEANQQISNMMGEHVAMMNQQNAPMEYSAAPMMNQMSQQSFSQTPQQAFNQVNQQAPPMMNQMRPQAPPMMNQMSQQAPPMMSQMSQQAPPMMNQMNQMTPPMMNHMNQQATHMMNQMNQQAHPMMNQQAPPMMNQMNQRAPPMMNQMSQMNQQGPPMMNQMNQQAPPMMNQMNQQAPPMMNQMNQQAPPMMSRVDQRASMMSQGIQQNSIASQMMTSQMNQTAQFGSRVQIPASDVRVIPSQQQYAKTPYSDPHQTESVVKTTSTVYETTTAGQPPAAQSLTKMNSSSYPQQYTTIETTTVSQPRSQAAESSVTQEYVETSAPVVSKNQPVTYSWGNSGQMSFGPTGGAVHQQRSSVEGITPNMGVVPLAQVEQNVEELLQQPSARLSRMRTASREASRTASVPGVAQVVPSVTTTTVVETTVAPVEGEWHERAATTVSRGEITTTLNEMAADEVSVLDYYKPENSDPQNVLMREIPLGGRPSLGMPTIYDTRDVRAFEYLQAMTTVEAEEEFVEEEVEVHHHREQRRRVSSSSSCSCDGVDDDCSLCSCSRSRSHSTANGHQRYKEQQRNHHHHQSQKVEKKAVAKKVVAKESSPAKKESSPAKKTMAKKVASPKKELQQEIVVPREGEEVSRTTAYFHYFPELATRKTNPFPVMSHRADMTAMQTIRTSSPNPSEKVDVYVTSIGEGGRNLPLYGTASTGSPVRSVQTQAINASAAKAAKTRGVEAYPAAPLNAGGSSMISSANHVAGNSTSRRQFNEVMGEGMGPAESCHCW